MPSDAGVELVGERSRLRIRLGGTDGHESWPVVASTYMGFTPLGAAITAAVDQYEVSETAGMIGQAEEGAFVALLDEADGRPPLAILQGEAGPFYSGRQSPRAPRVWRDFVFRTVFTAVEKADERWGPPGIVITHPTEPGWEGDTYTIVLEALGYLVDRRELTAGEVILGCIHHPDLESEYFNGAVRLLNEERLQSNSPEFRPFEVIEDRLTSIGAEDSEGAVLYRIPMDD